MPDESQPPPVMPSFASLRGPQRRSAMDWLDPVLPPAPVVAAPAPARAPAPAPAPSLPPRAPRPAEWPDLLLLGVHVARSLACLPARVALWSLRHLTGTPPVSGPPAARPGAR